METPIAEPLLYRVEAAAQLLGTSRSTVFELLHEGQLESVQIGRSRRITRSALERYVRTLTENTLTNRGESGDARGSDPPGMGRGVAAPQPTTGAKREGIFEGEGSAPLAEAGGRGAT